MRFLLLCLARKTMGKKGTEDILNGKYFTVIEYKFEMPFQTSFLFIDSHFNLWEMIKGKNMRKEIPSAKRDREEKE